MARVDVQRHLRPDEDVEATMDAGTGRLVVTTHRVFAATPERDGPNLAAARRPNVEAVEREADSDSAHLERGIKASLVGFLLLGIAAAVDLGSLIGGASVDSSTAGQLGVGQVVAMLDALQTGLVLLDAAMLVGGAVAVVAGLASLGLFLRTRQHDLVVRVAGDDDLRLDADVNGADMHDADNVSDTDLAALQQRLELD